MLLQPLAVNHLGEVLYWVNPSTTSTIGLRRADGTLIPIPTVRAPCPSASRLIAGCDSVNRLIGRGGIWWPTQGASRQRPPVGGDAIAINDAGLMALYSQTSPLSTRRPRGTLLCTEHLHQLSAPCERVGQVTGYVQATPDLAPRSTFYGTPTSV